MVGTFVLFYGPDDAEPVPALVHSVDDAGDGTAPVVTLIVLDVGQLQAPAAAEGEPAPEPVDVARAYVERVTLGQPGKDSGPFYAPRS